MAEITRAYEFVIMAAGSTSTADLTFTDADFVQAPVYSTWSVDIFEARAESRPFEVEVIDSSEQVTANLSDSGGRADLLGRFWRFRVNEDGGGLTTVAQGRIQGIRMSGTLGSYVFLCGDEMYLARNHNLFEDVSDVGTATSQIWPPGLRSQWKHKTAAPEARCYVESTDTSRSDSQKAVQLLCPGEPGFELSPSLAEWIRNDVKVSATPGSTGTSTGHFNHLRFRTGGADYEVLGFAYSLAQPSITYELDDDDGTGHLLVVNLWIAWDTSQPTVDTYLDGTLYAPTAPASDVLPFHIGGQNGVDMFDYWADRMDDAGMLYDSNAFSAWDASTNPQGLLARPGIPYGHLRVTEPMTLEELGRRLMKKHLLAPFENSSGQMYPKPIYLEYGINPSTYTQVTSAHFTRDGHPTWHQRGTDIVTVYRSRTEEFLPIPQQAEDFPADRLRTFWLDAAPIEHDRVDDLGRHVYEQDMWGSPVPGVHQADELFDRFGDGPIYGVWKALSAVDTIQHGDYVRINLSSYPDLATQTRGGVRVVQVVAIERGPDGARYEYLDAGADDNAFSAPGIAIAKNSSRPKHDVDVTISSFPAGADSYIVEIKVGSNQWQYGATGTTNETVTIPNLPSGTTIQARVAALSAGRNRSAWATPVSVLLDSLTAPSSASASISGTTATLTWTNGESQYAIMPTLDGADHLKKPLRAGSTWFVFHGLTASTEYDFGVKHVDPYGGESAADEDTQTTGTAETIETPRGTRTRGKKAQTTRISEEVGDFGSGIEVGVLPGSSYAQTEVEIDTSSGFSTDPRSYFLGNGRTMLRIHLPLDNALRYIRTRHVAAGFTSSSWTATAQATPAPFQTTEAVTFEDARIKIVRVQHTAFDEPSHTGDYAKTLVYLSPQGTTQRAFYANVSLPPGVTVTQVRFRFYTTNAGDIFQGAFVTATADLTAGGSAVNDSATGSTGNQWLTITPDVEIVADESYGFRVIMTNASAANDCRFGFVEVTYTVPSAALETV